METLISIIIFLLGLLIGSFLNAYIWRLHIGESVRHGRSYCPKCRHTLTAQDLIPLMSFIMLRGRCRYCSKKISWQYPLVEAVTAISWLGLYLWFGLTASFIVYSLWTAILIVIFVYDLLHELILDKVTVPAMFFVFITAFFIEANFINIVIAAIIAGGFFLIQYLATQGRWVGGGDIRLGLVMGLMLGWPLVGLAIGLAYIIGAFVGIALIASRRKSMSSHVPFGTFLTIATYASFYIGSTNFLDNYFI